MKIQTPWSKEQIEGLERYQSCGLVHPYTCGNSSLHEDLIPTESGWICNNCSYTQNWAHEFSVLSLELYKRLLSVAQPNKR